tara:strand:+ start:28157 stop:28531 length:375 start_codon:yes stop_codon:yes gene_type:complete
MPTYQYQCDNCDHYFEIVQSMKDKKKKTCPECKKPKLKRLLGQPMIFVKGEPSTIGHWAERNTEKMGRYELGDRTGQQKEANEKAKKQPSEKQPWYKKHQTASNSEVSKMSESQKQRYIKDGKK